MEGLEDAQADMTSAEVLNSEVLPLEALCIQYITFNIGNLTTTSKDEESITTWKYLGKGYLSPSLAEPLLDSLSEKGLLGHRLLSLFNAEQCGITYATLNVATLEKSWSNNENSSLGDSLYLKGHDIRNLTILDGIQNNALDVLDKLPKKIFPRLNSLFAINRHNLAHGQNMPPAQCLTLLSQMSNIRELSLFGCSFIGQEQLDLLCNEICKLETIDLSMTNIQDISPLRKYSSHLKGLLLPSTPVLRDYALLKSSLETFTKLEVLDIGVCSSDTPSPTWLSEFIRCCQNHSNFLPHLDILELYGLEITTGDVENVIELCSCRDLGFIGLADTDLEADSITIIRRDSPKLEVAEDTSLLGILSQLKRYKHCECRLAHMLRRLLWDGLSVPSPREIPSNQLINELIDVVFLYRDHKESPAFKDALVKLAALPQVVYNIGASHASWCCKYQSIMCFLLEESRGDAFVAGNCFAALGFQNSLDLLFEPHRVLTLCMKTLNQLYVHPTVLAENPDFMVIVYFLDSAFGYIRYLTDKYQELLPEIQEDIIKDFTCNCISALKFSLLLGSDEDEGVPQAVISCFSILRHIIESGVPVHRFGTLSSLRHGIIKCIKSGSQQLSSHCESMDSENSFWRMIIKAFQLLETLENFDYIKHGLFNEELLEAIMLRIRRTPNINGNTFISVWWTLLFYLRNLLHRPEYFDARSLYLMQNTLDRVLKFERRSHSFWNGLRTLIFKYPIDEECQLPINRIDEICCDIKHGHLAPGHLCTSVLLVRFYSAYLYHATQRYLRLENALLLKNTKLEVEGIMEAWPGIIDRDPDTGEYLAINLSQRQEEEEESYQTLEQESDDL